MTEYLTAMAGLPWQLWAVIGGLWLAFVLALVVEARQARRRTLPDWLHAAGDTITLHAASAAVLAADTPRRILSGLALPYGEPGSATVNGVGMLIQARAGSMRVPAELSRIKLVDMHQTPPRAIGYAIAHRITPEGDAFDFHVPQTPEGDRAMLEASQHLADGLSVELADLDLDYSTTPPTIRDSLLTAVAQLPVPAFGSARVASVLASQHNTGGTTPMTPEQRARLAELMAMSGRTAEQETEYQQLTQLAVQEAAQAQPEQTPEQQAPAAPAQATQTPALAAGQSPALSVPQGVATAPAGLTPQGAGSGSARPLTDLYAAMGRVLSGQSQPQMEAALSDITNTANPYVAQDQYAGQLWAGLDYQRRFVPLMAAGELTSWKGTGWRWVVEPEVTDYAGDKTDVPSNAPTTEDEPWTAARLAGAHDIDRKFRDFGDSSFIEAYYKAMTLSYARKSDAKARAFIIASATAGAAVVGNLLTAAATVVQRVEDATDGGAADYVLVNSTDKLALLDVTQFDVPAFLSTWNINPERFIGTTAVPAGTVVAGMRQASEFKELSGSPIRVEAINVAKGGIDGGVFGYYATLLHEATGIQKATFAPAP